MNKRLLLTFVVGIAIVGTMVYLASRGGGIRPASHHAILASVSDSDGCGCECMVGTVQEILDKHDYKRDLVIELFRSGDNQTANEPVPLGEPLKIPASGQYMEVGNEKIKIKKREILDAVRARCQKMPVTNVSPIYISSKSVVEHLNRYGCGTPSADCHAWISSDLEETEEPGLVDAIKGVKKGRPMPSQISNASVQITFCGLAQTVGQTQDSRGRETWKTKKRDAQRIDLLMKLWPSQFTNPGGVEIRHFCSQPSESPTFAGK